MYQVRLARLDEIRKDIYISTRIPPTCSLKHPLPFSPPPVDMHVVSAAGRNVLREVLASDGL